VIINVTVLKIDVRNVNISVAVLKMIVAAEVILCRRIDVQLDLVCCRCLARHDDGAVFGRPEKSVEVKQVQLI
jgi:hypothetical protein